MTEAITKLDKRVKATYTENAPMRKVQNELYTYVLPFRRPADNDNSPTKDIDKIFDSTAPKAAFRFAGRMEQEVTPPFQDFFELKSGPLFPAANADEKKQVDEALEQISKLVSATLQGSNFSVAMGEMYLDLFGGTGALLMEKDEDNILDFISVPISQLAIGEDGKGRVKRIYWGKSYEVQELQGKWPKGKLPKEVHEKIKEDGSQKIMCMQCTEYDKKTKLWIFTAYLPDYISHGEIYKDSGQRTNPWLTPRFYKVPGEAMGRGPGMMALPTIKVLNTVTELTIKAAAFAILGLWTARNDRVFNPRTARMTPGAIWKVGSNGGHAGPTLSKLDVPGRFDVSNLIMTDLRMMAKEAMLDDTLPPDAGSVRSATEIVERMKRLSRDLAGAYGRLVLEIIRPVIQRVIDALHERGLLPEAITIDQLIYKIQVISPIARSQQASQVSAIVEWLQIMGELGGKEMMMLTARVETIFTDIGRKLGVSETHMRGDVEKKKIQEVVAKIIANAQAAASQAQAPPGEAGAETAQGARPDLVI